MIKYRMNIHHVENDNADRRDSIQYNDMFDRVRSCILGVELTNVFHDNHEQIDIFHHICKNQSHDMNDIVRFYSVAMLFYYLLTCWYRLMLPLYVKVVLTYVESSCEVRDRQQLSNRLWWMVLAIKH